MKPVKLTEDEAQEVLRERFAHPCPKVQRRMEVLHLRHLGKSYSEIIEIVACSHSSVARCLRMYHSGGLQALKVIDYNRPPSVLESHRRALESYFKENPPSSVREAISRIRELTGVERSERVVRKFLRSCGMSYRKTGRVPGKADRKAQEEFKKKAWSQDLRRRRKVIEKSTLSTPATSYGKGL